MGPATLLAVGRALLVAVGGATVFGRDGALRIVAEELVAAVERQDFEVARAMIRNMQREHRIAFEAFVAKYGDQLPPEFRREVEG
jgi:hypothetical protein